MFSDESRREFGPYWQVIGGIHDFIKTRQETIACCRVKVYDESMSPYAPSHSVSGNLPNISYIMRKPEPLGVEFKTGCDANSGVMIYVELQRGKDVMKLAHYNAEYGATTGCSLRMREAMVGCGQRRIPVNEAADSDDDEFSDLPVSAICDELQRFIMSLVTNISFFF